MKSLFKNLSVKQISLYITVAVWITHVFILSAILFINKSSIKLSFSYILFYGVLSFVISYFLIRFLFESFVFRKIKLIYKIISTSKDSLSNINEGKETTLEQVNERVSNWAIEREKEISGLKELESYRKNFVGDISHELKTPLFAIQGFLHTLLDGGLYDEKINSKYLLRAAKNAERLQFIVEDLEMINLLEAEASNLDIESFNLKMLAIEVMDEIEVLASEKGIKVLFKSGADGEFKVSADREKIRQVLVNLISNSIKYGTENGKTKISFYDMDELILVEVSDNGIGIENKHLRFLFDRFYRADKSRARDIGGSGLGLSIVKHILEAHGQGITVRSTLNQGSTFGFTLKKG